MNRLVYCSPLLALLLLAPACSGEGPGPGPGGDACSDTPVVDLSAPMTLWEGTYEGMGMAGQTGAIMMDLRAADEALLVTAPDGTVYEDSYNPAECDAASVFDDGRQMTLSMNEGDRVMSLGIASVDGANFVMSLTVEEDSTVVLGGTFSAELPE